MSEYGARVGISDQNAWGGSTFSQDKREVDATECQISYSTRQPIGRGVHSYMGTRRPLEEVVPSVTVGLAAEGTPWTLGELVSRVLSLTASVTSGSVTTNILNIQHTDVATTSPKDPFAVITRTSGTGDASTVQVLDCNISKLKMSVERGGVLQVTADIVGSGRTSTSNFGVGTAALHSEAFTWDTCSFSRDLAAVEGITGFSLEIDEAIEPVYSYDGSQTAYALRRTAERRVSFAITKRSNYITDFLDVGSAELHDIAIHFEGSEVQSGYPHSLTIELFNVLHSNWQTTHNRMGAVEHRITGQAYADPNVNVTEITMTHVSSMGVL